MKEIGNISYRKMIRLFLSLNCLYIFSLSGLRIHAVNIIMVNYHWNSFVMMSIITEQENDNYFTFHTRRTSVIGRRQEKMSDEIEISLAVWQLTRILCRISKVISLPPDLFVVYCLIVYANESLFSCCLKPRTDEQVFTWKCFVINENLLVCTSPLCIFFFVQAQLFKAGELAFKRVQPVGNCSSVGAVLENGWQVRQRGRQGKPKENFLVCMGTITRCVRGGMITH